MGTYVNGRSWPISDLEYRQEMHDKSIPHCTTRSQNLARPREDPDAQKEVIPAGAGMTGTPNVLRTAEKYLRFFGFDLF